MKAYNRSPYDPFSPPKRFENMHKPSELFSGYIIKHTSVSRLFADRRTEHRLYVIRRTRGVLPQHMYLVDPTE